MHLSLYTGIICTIVMKSNCLIWKYIDYRVHTIFSSLSSFYGLNVHVCYWIITMYFIHRTQRMIKCRIVPPETHRICAYNACTKPLREFIHALCFYYVIYYCGQENLPHH